MRLKNQSLVVEVVSGIGKTYSKLKNYSQALHYLGIALKAAKEIKRIPHEREAAREMFSIYAAQGDYKNALHLHQLFHQVDKVLIDQTGKKEVQRLNALYETEKKKGQAELLKKDKEIGELSLSKARITRNISIAGFFLAAVILGLLLKKYFSLFAFWKKKKTMGRFRLMEKIGSGAIGTVYKAHSLVNKSETAAVKVLKDELCTDETSKKRFKREAVIIDKLGHPNIVKIIERGEYKQRLFTAMELLEGKTLAAKLKERGQLPLRESLHIMEQISEALVLIHGKNIMHRDLKPANIMLIQNNGDPSFVKLLDFGLAKMEFQTRLTQPGSFIGTIEYISPEQVLNSDSSPANDIFSMGVMCYRMISGQNPFSGETVMDVLRQIIGKVPQDLNKIMSNVPDLLNLLVKKMMDKDPGQRPSATVVRNTLRRLMG
jgi:tRNA A-37 threonylcarbamoyl transferase component Bud32